MPKQVQANQKGFYKDRLIQEGEIFLVDNGETALWFDDVADASGGDNSASQYSQMRLSELKETAAQLGIELAGNETKAEIIAKLNAE